MHRPVHMETIASFVHRICRGFCNIGGSNKLVAIIIADHLIYIYNNLTYIEDCLRD